MFKPPKTSLLAALIVTAGCKGGATEQPRPPGKYAEPVQPAPADPDEHAVGDWAEEKPEEPDADKPQHEVDRVGTEATPDDLDVATPHKVGIVAKPIEPVKKPKPADPE